MLKIGICDDERIHIDVIRSYCNQYFQDRKEIIEIREYNSGKKVLEEEDLDILFLDIEMPETSGLAVKKYFQVRSANIRIIFCTSHVEACQEAFGKYVFGFLTKPIVYEIFQKRMNDVMYDWQTKNAVVTYECGQQPSAICIRDIIYVKAAGRYSKLKIVNDEKEIFCNDKSLGIWKKELADYGFALCHRSYCVNLAFVKKCGDEVLLGDGSRIPVSRRMRTEFESLYWDFIADMAH